MELHQIELGHGDKIVSDIYDKAGKWVGIAISDGDVPVGESVTIEADTVGQLNAELTIVTSNPKSLDVIIQACERAKDRLTNWEAAKAKANQWDDVDSYGPS